MGIVLKELLRSLSVQQRSNDNRSDGDPGALDPWAPPTDSRITYNIWVGHYSHGESLANLLASCNLLPALTSWARLRDGLALAQGMGRDAIGDWRCRGLAVS